MDTKTSDLVPPAEQGFVDSRADSNRDHGSSSHGCLLAVSLTPSSAQGVRIVPCVSWFSGGRIGWRVGRIPQVR